jgi:hypothetical protein
MAVWYANEKAFKHGTALPKFTTLDDLGVNEPTHPASPCVPTITDLEIPQFTSLDIKGLKSIGVSLKWIC